MGQTTNSDIMRVLLEIRQDITGLHQETTSLRQNITGLQQETAELRKEMHTLTMRVDDIGIQLRALRKTQLEDSQAFASVFVDHEHRLKRLEKQRI